MSRNIKKKIIRDKDISYLNRDFTSFRNELVRYAKTHYGDTIFDFSESSLAGLLVDMAAYVGDVLSYYQDHQFNELNLETVVERDNLDRMIRLSGVDNVNASPSIVNIECKIRVDSVINSVGNIIPDPNLLPIIRRGTILSTSSGVEFELTDDIDFSEKDEAGDLIAKVEIGSTDADNNPLNYFLTMTGLFTSSKTTTETFIIGNDLVPFRTITLKNKNVSEIISVTDSIFDEYYEVDSLTQDTVYIREKNDLADYLSVPERLKIIPAPKRFEKISRRTTGITTLRFGAGNEDIFDEDVIPDPSEHAIKLFGDRKTVNFATIDPNSFLGTRTLGISPRNTTLRVKYRHGGGLSHNVSANSINSVVTLITKFPESVSSFQVANIRASLRVVNKTAATGGEDEPTFDELRRLALNSKNSQGRMVTKEDLLTRVYSIPNNFGRVFRASVRNNPFNPFSSHLHLISRNIEGKLVNASDSLKENISTYLSKYRLITDAIDIVDAIVINIGVDYNVTVDETFNPLVVIQTINFRLGDYLNIKNFQIDQPIIISELQNIILNTQGVVSLLNLDVVNLSGRVGANNYSDTSFNVLRYLHRGILYPLPGGIFEVKFPNDDIKGRSK